MAGRPPVPTALKLLRGNPGKRPLPSGEPRPAAVEPQMPGYLDPIARREWKRTAPRLVRLGLLTEADGELFGGYCQTVSDLARINKAMRACGYKMLAEKHTVDGAGNEHLEVKTNPLVIQRRNALAQLRYFCQEFGLTPSSRAKIQVPARGESDPQEDFLNGG